MSKAARLPIAEPEAEDDDGTLSDESDTFCPATYKSKIWRSFKKNSINLEPLDDDDIGIAENFNIGEAVEHFQSSPPPVAVAVLDSPVKSSQPLSVDGEGEDDEDNDLSACMFGGGHKLNLRDGDFSEPEPTESPDEENNNTTIPIIRDSSDEEQDYYYQPGPKRIKVLACPEIADPSRFTSRDKTLKHVYFEPEDFELGDVEKLTKADAVWNEEFDGCLVSRGKSRNTVCGIIKMRASAIRPFGRVEANASLQLVVLKGEVVVKSTAVSLNPNNELICKSLKCKVGDWTLIPSGVPFSLENNTKRPVELAYTCNEG